jgi:hypothetical protein
MADFAPKKDASKAKGSLPKDNAEHQPPPMIHLEEHHIAKLFPHDKALPPVGSKIKISGLVHVGAHSEHQDSMQEPGRKIGTGATTPKDTRRSMTLHLHKMEVGKDGGNSSNDVDQEAEKAKGAKAEMDKALERQTGGKKSRSEEGYEGSNAADSTPRGVNAPRT